MDLKTSVAKILGLLPSALQLLDIKEGCAIVSLLIPKIIGDSIFSSLDDKYISELQALSIMWLKFQDFYLLVSERGSTQRSAVSPELSEVSNNLEAVQLKSGLGSVEASTRSSHSDSYKKLPYISDEEKPAIGRVPEITIIADTTSNLSLQRRVSLTKISSGDSGLGMSPKINLRSLPDKSLNLTSEDYMEGIIEKEPGNPDIVIFDTSTPEDPRRMSLQVLDPKCLRSAKLLKQDIFISI